ncbi:hypothetical protein JHK82_023979 [Glycine max]|nr:hypothetical protein JHK82_023979 [Glycine max]
MAPPQADLRKIGAEGFALIDKFYGPARRNSVNDAFHGRRGDRCWVVYNVSNDVMEDSAAIGMEATTGHFAAKSAMNYPKAASLSRWIGTGTVSSRDSFSQKASL